VTIVVGYVPKPEGRAALHAAVEQARLRGESLHVLNSTRGDSYLDSSFASESELEEIRRVLRESGVPFELEQKIGGRGGADDVIDVAESTKATLVVIGLRHRTATGKLIFGSDAQRILLDVECPVLAVKAVRGA
jgi:nucleotide-binding universal stress UspA family protein